MFRSMIVTAILLGGAAFMTSTLAGYSGAGRDYFKKAREERKSIRSGSGYFSPGMGRSGSFRAGK